MKHYALMANPGHNRIYFDTALKIGYAEITALLAKQNIELIEYSEAGLPIPAAFYFSVQQELTQQAIDQLSAASVFYALFEIKPDGLLKPLTFTKPFTFPESISQILKYNGKTNEQFTRLMLNLANNARTTSSTKPTLFDPMCGKGTTLYEGLIFGWDIVGVEINDDWVQETQAFLTKFMKNGRYKHKAVKEKRTGEKGKKLCNCFVLNAAAEKQHFGSQLAQQLRLFDIDTRLSDKVIKKNSCDMIISDLPYGVQHGSKSSKQNKMERSPLELLDQSLPAWLSPLKKGGSIVLSFNEFTLKWRDAAELMEKHGLTVLSETPYTDLLHRVDQSINRNIIVAVY